jgi:hypothetical protein
MTTRGRHRLGEQRRVVATFRAEPTLLADVRAQAAAGVTLSQALNEAAHDWIAKQRRNAIAREKRRRAKAGSGSGAPPIPQAASADSP